MIRGIIFDKDGTLVDFETTWVPALLGSAHAMAELAGCPELAGDMLNAVGREPVSGRIQAGTTLAAGTTDEVVAVWRRIAPALPPEREAVAWLDAYWGRVTDENFTPVCDTPALFRQLAEQDCQLGIATNDAEAAAYKCVSRLDVTELVSFVAGYDSGYGAKPDPGMLRAFCRAHHLTPDLVAMVGDSKGDLVAGRAAGCGLVVGVLSGASATADLEPYADVIIPDISVLPELL